MELEGKAKAIGEALLSLNKQFETVCMVTGQHKGLFRVQPVKVIAGKKNKKALYKESGCTFLVHLGKVFFSPRLGTERARISKLIKKGEVVGAFFAGVGPFPIVFAKNSRVYNWMKLADYRNHTIQISFTTYNYSEYYLDQARNGEMSYSIQSRCRSYETDFLDLFDADSGLAIMTSKNLTMLVCTNSTAATVQIDMDADQEDWYHIFLHDGDYREVSEYPLRIMTGTTETIKVLDKAIKSMP